MNYKEFKKELYENIIPNKHKDIRDGQAIINYLADVWFEEYKRLFSVHYYDETNIDCFYNDLLIPNTLKHLEKVWKNYPN